MKATQPACDQTCEKSASTRTHTQRPPNTHRRGQHMMQRRQARRPGPQARHSRPTLFQAHVPRVNNANRGRPGCIRRTQAITQRLRRIRFGPHPSGGGHGLPLSPPLSLGKVGEATKPCHDYRYCQNKIGNEFQEAKESARPRQDAFHKHT
eukprot:355673-Chlamydomonas_euryale.AAC.2